MLVVHWSPVKNTKNIMKNGISKSKNGLYCFPLTGKKIIDRWWVRAFNQSNYRKYRTHYNGFIFRIKKEDLPAVFDHAYGYTSRDNFEMQIYSLKELKLRYRERIIHKIGEKIVKYNFSKTEEAREIAKNIYNKWLFRFGHTHYKSLDDPILLEDAYSDWLESKSINEFVPILEMYLEMAKAEIENNPVLFNESSNSDEFLEKTFSDWQIILTRAISPNRIIKIVSDRNEYGRVLYKQKKINKINN
jgi:hypothetical protein